MQPQTLTGQASLVTPSRKRFFIMVLLFITVVINYLDRSNLSIAAPALTSDLGIDPIHVGLIFSAFGWTYAAMQIPGGWLVDRVPPRILYTAALLLWSIATVMLGFAGSFIALFVLRMAVGALEAPAYPINSRVVTTWFPERERATAIGFYTSGQFVGLASITWSLVSTLAPARLLGLTGGVFNFIGNLAAIATPIVIGFLATGDSFAPAITYISVLALIGALSYILLVGKVERIKL